uniref:Peptidase A1 domain-containing protein n=1 Tax=Ditylenchus dipsaci TaxID=166011 RepID=A0A915DQX2_9BILA
MKKSCKVVLTSSSSILTIQRQNIFYQGARILQCNLINSCINSSCMHKIWIQPFLDYYDGFYLANITLGNPPQPFTMALDTGSSDFWVIEHSKCKSEACSGGNLVNKHTKRHFYPEQSTTFREDGQGRRFSIRYGKGRTTGRYVQDYISFGSLYFENQTFGLADSIADVLGYQPVDGVLGLAWPSIAEYKINPPVHNMLRQLDEPLFTVWIDRRRPDFMGGSGGIVTFGGKDQVNCDSEWNYVPLYSRSLWQIRVQEFRIGNYRSWRRRFAISDTGTALLGGPHGLVNIIIAAVNAQYSVSHDMYVVPCDNRSNLSDIIFTMESLEYHITPSEYVLDLGLGDGNCALGVFGMYSDGFNADWIFGDTFIDSYCTLYDIGKGRRRPDFMGGSGGIVTFGGKDQVNCDSEWNYVPLYSRSLWQIRVQEFRIGNYRSWRRRFAISDTGTALLGGPHGLVNIIIAAVNAQYSVSHDMYVVPCDNRSNLSDIIFTMESLEYHITPSEYVLDLGLGDGNCALGVFGMYSDGFNADWIFGDTFIDSYCTLYDIGKGRLGFAKAKDAIQYN